MQVFRNRFQGDTCVRHDHSCSPFTAKYINTIEVNNRPAEKQSVPRTRSFGKDLLGLVSDFLGRFTHPSRQLLDEIKAKNEKLEKSNTQLQQMNQEMSQMNEALSDSLVASHELHQNITDGINHASRLQGAILPDVSVLDHYFENAFVELRAKDIVSGDFYWFHEIDENQILIAVADCTGHGVPGAMMVMTAMGLLEHAIGRLRSKSPKNVLSMTSKWFLNHMDYDNAGVPDGMDVSLILWRKASREVTFVGANQKIYIVTQNEIEVFDGDHFAIDGVKSASKAEFTEHTFTLPAGASLYMVSDGWQDQFGVNDKKFGHKRMRETMLEAQQLSPEERKPQILETIKTWQGYEEQTDDILIVGLFG